MNGLIVNIKNKLLLHANMCMNNKNISMSKKIYIQRNANCMILHKLQKQTKPTHGVRIQDNNCLPGKWKEI